MSDGSITWFGFNTDITERKKTEAELFESEVHEYVAWSILMSAVAHVESLGKAHDAYT